MPLGLRPKNSAAMAWDDGNQWIFGARRHPQRHTVWRDLRFCWLAFSATRTQPAKPTDFRRRVPKKELFVVGAC